MNKIRLITVLLFLMLVASGVYAQHNKYYFYHFGGRAVLSRTQGSTWLALQPGQPMELHPGDIINVEGNGRGEINFPDGTSVRMKNNAMVTLDRYGINLRMGYVWLNVRRSADMFKVITPKGSCSVLGTSFDVDVDKYGKARVRVFQGIVAVRASDDKRNKQLVLQAGMHTLLGDSTKVADKPEKFQHQSIEAALHSEWEQKNVYTGITQMRPGNTSAAEEFAAKHNEDANTSSAPVITSDGFLPLIRKDDKIEMEFKPIEKILENEPGTESEEGKIKIMARQRSEFAEMLRQQQLERDAVIGFSIPEKKDMMKDGHALSFGESSRTSENITDYASLEREYSLLRNRLLRVQSQIRQKEMEIGALCSKNDASTGNKLKIRNAQNSLKELRSESRIVTAKLRELQHKKK